MGERNPTVGRGVVRALAMLCAVACLAAWPGIGQASPSLLQIRGVQIAAITDTSFLVSWTTDQTGQNSGQITYGTSPTTVHTLVSDDAEPSGAKGDTHWHLFTGLTPAATYYFQITMAGVIDNNNGQYYSVKLAPTLTNPPPTRTVSGIVLQPDQHTPAAGALVTVWVLDNANLNGTGTTTSQQMAAWTDQSGAWTASLDVRTQNLSAYFNYTTTCCADYVQYTVDGASLGATSLQVISLNLNQNNNSAMSVPTVSLFVNTTSTTPTLTPTLTPTPTSSPASTPITPTAVASTPTAELSPSPPSTLVVVPTSAPVVAAAPPTAAAQPAEPTTLPEPPPTAVPIAPPVPVSPLLPVPPLAPTSIPPAPSQGRPVPTDTPAAPVQTLPSVIVPTIPASAPAAPLYPFSAPTSAAQALPAIGPAAPAASLLTPGVRPNEATPTPNATAIAEVVAKSGGLPAQATALLASGAALLGLGIALVMLGLVNQMRRGV
jgi:hypothetical protein